MASRVAIPQSIAAVCIAMIFMAGCGLKSPPEPYSKLAPKPLTQLTARPTKAGVEISFSIPEPDRTERTVVAVMLFFAYRPLDAKLPCAKCPLKLREHRTIKVGMDKKGKIQTGTFVFLDTKAPTGQMAVYQVRLKDATGKLSEFSPWAAAPRVDSPAAPAGLKAKPGAAEVKLSWQPVTSLAAGGKMSDLVGYIVYRKVEKKVTPITPKPITETSFVDETVITGKGYAYQVAAVRKVAGYTMTGAVSAWASATPQDLKPPEPPKNLITVSAPPGVYLRFIASADKDVAGYLVFRKPKAGGDWAQLNADPEPKNAFVDNTAKAGVTYVYRVVAVDRRGNQSKPSAEVEVTHEP